MEKNNILENLIEKVVKEISKEIIKEISNKGAWVDWYNGEETMCAVKELDYDCTVIDEYEEESPENDFWGEIDDEYRYDLYVLYCLALGQATNSDIKYRISVPENTNERIFYISDNTNEEYIPCSNWYGNNKKRLVDVAYEDNYDYAEEKYSFTKKELYSMIEELKTKNN